MRGYNVALGGGISQKCIFVVGGSIFGFNKHDYERVLL